MDISVENFEGGKEEWNNLISSFNSYDSHQSWEWGESIKSCSWEIERLIFKKGNCISGAACFQIKRKYGQNFVYSPRGPILDYTDLETLSNILKLIREKYSRSLFIKINPYVDFSDPVYDEIIKSGFIKTARNDLFDTTLIMNLNMSREDMWENIRPRFRTYIRKYSAAVKVRECDANGFVNDFCRIHEEMQALKGLGKTDIRKFREMLLCLSSSGIIRMRAAFSGEEMLAGIVVMRSGDRILYKWGAASRAGNEKFHASHILHWETALWAHDFGFKIYDLGGISSNNDNGVVIFKRGFSSLGKKLIGEFDFISRPLLYKIFVR